MVWVTYHCPYCGAVTGVERDAYLDDKNVTREPLDGWTYASTTDDDVESADGIEFVCLGDGYRGDETAPSDQGDAAAPSETEGDETAASETEGDETAASETEGDETAASETQANDAGTGGANDPRVDAEDCGRTFYLNFVKYDAGREVDHRTPDIDRPRFDFNQ